MVKILFLGRKNYGAQALTWLVENNFDVIGVVTDSHLELSPTLAVAERYGLKVYDYDKLHDNQFCSQIEFNVGLSYVFWKKIPKHLIKKPDLGFLNFHPAPLPDLKGTGGYNIAILEGLQEYGVSCHYMDETIDTGPIIDVKRFSIDPKLMTALDLERLSHKTMVKQVREVMLRVRQHGQLPSIRNDGGRYISRKQMEELKVIREGDDIDAKIRAFWYPPYSGAQMVINDRYYTLVNSDILSRLDGDDCAIFLEKSKLP